MKIVNRLETAKQLQRCEKKKEQFQKQLKALTSLYIKGNDCTIQFDIVTKDFEHKGVEDPMHFNKKLMIEYIKNEIAQLQYESNNLVKELAQ